MCPMETRRATLAETWRHGALGAAVTGECWNIKIFIPRVPYKHSISIQRQRQQRDLNSVLIVDSDPPDEHRNVVYCLVEGVITDLVHISPLEDAAEQQQHTPPPRFQS